MNATQRSKFNSLLVVRSLCARDTSLALTSGVPAWKALYDRFLAKIAYADACILTQASDATGVTAAKNATRAVLITGILETAGALCSLAFLREDPVLEGKADLLPSDLSNLPDALVDDKATELIALARAIPVPAPGSTAHGIAEVGLTAGKLETLEIHVETYNLLVGSPRAARGQKTVATAHLQETLEDLDRLLEKGLDKLALQFTGTTFHREYLLARNPISPATNTPTPAPAPAPPQP